MTDPLAPLLALRDVEPAVLAARAAVDAAYKHPALRRKGGQVAAEVSLRSAVASTALEGLRYDVEDVRGGTVLDAVLHGALRVAQALPGLMDRWPTAPRQVLARLHLLAGTGVLPVERLGRPEAAASARLDALCELITTKAGNPLVRTAVVHAELLAIEAFAGVNGVVARAAGRLTMMSSGFDPRGLLDVETVQLAREPEYLGTARSFATGTPDGVRSWLRHYATAAELSAAAVAGIGDRVLASTNS